MQSSGARRHEELQQRLNTTRQKAATKLGVPGVCLETNQCVDRELEQSIAQDTTNALADVEQRTGVTKFPHSCYKRVCLILHSSIIIL